MRICENYPYREVYESLGVKIHDGSLTYSQYRP